MATGQNVIMLCMLPTNQQDWWRRSSDHFEKLVNNTDEHLFLNNTTLSDAGYYYCGGKDNTTWSEPVEVVVNPRTRQGKCTCEKIGCQVNGIYVQLF